MKTRHVLERNLSPCRKLCTALSEVHHLSAAAVGILRRHHAEHKSHCHQKEQKGKQLRQEPILLRHIMYHRVYVIFSQKLLNLFYVRHIQLFRLLYIAQRNVHDTCRHLRIGLNLRTNHFALLKLCNQLALGIRFLPLFGEAQPYRHRD